MWGQQRNEVMEYLTLLTYLPTLALRVVYPDLGGNDNHTFVDLSA